MLNLSNSNFKRIRIGTVILDLTNAGRQHQRKSHLKNNVTISFVLLRDYFNSFNFYTKDELPRNQIGRSGVQVKKENEKFPVAFSRSPHNLEFGHFTLLFCRARQRNVAKFKTHVQRDCFCSFACCFVVLPSPLCDVTL